MQYLTFAPIFLQTSSIRQEEFIGVTHKSPFDNSPAANIAPIVSSDMASPSLLINNTLSASISKHKPISHLLSITESMALLTFFARGSDGLLGTGETLPFISYTSQPSFSKKSLAIRVAVPLAESIRTLYRLFLIVDVSKALSIPST